MVIARGQWWAGLPAALEVWAIAIILAFALMAIVRDFGWFVLFLVGFVCPLVAGTFSVAVWALSAGRVRYEVEGSTIHALRGRRTIATIDSADFDEIVLAGRLTWANTLLKGAIITPFGMLDGLPRLEAIKTINRWEDERVYFPHILIWGRRAGDEVQSRLLAELDRTAAEQP